MDSAFLYGANVHANGIRQHYLRFGGRGTPLVFIPGINSPAITWGFVGERLGRKFDTYLLDCRGRGLSESGPGLDYGLDSMAADVAAFSDTLQLPEFVLAGHSMGARIAIRAARSLGPNLSKLILIDPPVTGPGRRKYPMSLEWMLQVYDTARAGIGLEEMRQFVPTWEDRHIGLRAEWLPNCDRRAIEVAYRGFGEDDIHSDLPHLKMPVLLVVAGKGGVILPPDVEEIKQLLPAINVERVENSGHMIPWEDCDGLFRAFVPFLGTDL